MIVLEANATKHFKQKDNYNSNIKGGCYAHQFIRQ